MNSATKILKPDEPELSGGARTAPGRRLLFWLTLALALVAIAALLFFIRLRHLEREIVRLNRQIDETKQGLQQVDERSEAALRRASQAEANAQQAAQGREQAQKARAQSEKEAELAHQQAEAAQTQVTFARQQAEQLRKEREEELGRLQQVLGQIAETRRTAMGLVMTLGSNSIRFDFDKAVLRPENREVLSRIAGVLVSLKGYSIYVYGYTDDVGSEKYNLNLSQRRAGAVRDYLVQAGLNPGIITTKGYGKSDPRIRGNTSNARAINRRVEIGLVDSHLRFHELPPPGK